MDLASDSLLYHLPPVELTAGVHRLHTHCGQVRVSEHGTSELLTRKKQLPSSASGFTLNPSSASVYREFLRFIYLYFISDVFFLSQLC